MKSFKQFLDENYLSEERPARRAKSNAPSYDAAKAAQDAKEAAAAERRASRVPTGAAADPSKQFKPQVKTTKVASPTRKPSGAATDPWMQFPKKPRQQLGMPKEGPSSTLPGRTLAPAGGTTPKASLPPAGGTGGVDKQAQLRQIAAERQAKRSAEQAAKATKTGSLVKATPSGLTAPVGSKSNPQQIRTNMNVPGGKTPKMPKMPKGVGKWAGRGLAALGASADTADEYKAQRSKGRSRKSSLGMGVTKAAGGLAGAQAGASSGAALGATVGSVVPGAGTAVGGLVGGVAGGIGGYYAGSKLAGKASEVTAGATGREKKAMATANRQRQAGTAVKGIGGNTTFSQKKPGGPAFMSTGVGKQRSTVQLGKTGVVQRGGQSVAGHLAFKGGKAVYKAGPSAQSLAKTSSNPLERIGRTIAPGAYKKHDAAKAKQALTKATQSDISRGQKLGVKYKPGG